MAPELGALRPPKTPPLPADEDVDGPRRESGGGGPTHGPPGGYGTLTAGGTPYVAHPLAGENRPAPPR